ncbi:unnamed protein product [Caenorhabditis nigoni]
MGPNSLDFPDFEFWWMRFSAGNFDLDYDRSQDPKCRTITDLPVNIFEKICENLGDNYQKEYRFTLRNVCKSFRSLADSWVPKFDKLVIEAFSNLFTLDFDGQYFQYSDENKALNDLMSVIAHPEHKLTNLDIDEITNQQFLDKLLLEMKSRKFKIHIENVHLNSDNWKDQMRLLPFYQAETVKMVYIEGWQERNSEFIDEICKIDQEERAGDDQIEKIENPKPKSILFSRVEISFDFLSNKEATKIIKNFLKLPNLKYCHLKAELRNIVQMKKNIQRLGANIQTDRLDILHYPIQNSNDVFEIQIQLDGIRIKQKSVED